MSESSEDNTWVRLLRRLPANLHDGLTLILTTGAELVVQRFIRLEADVLVLRGRMAGTQDTGRVVIIPYSQLTALALGKLLIDAEIQSIFGEEGGEFAAPLPAAEAPADVPAPPTVNGDGADVNTPSKPAMPSKSLLLAKLRARLAEKK